jgi:hypothetical protein
MLIRWSCARDTRWTALLDLQLQSLFSLHSRDFFPYVQGLLAWWSEIVCVMEVCSMSMLSDDAYECCKVMSNCMDAELDLTLYKILACIWCLIVFANNGQNDSHATKTAKG